MSKIDRREFLKLVGAGGVGAYAGYMIAESIKHPAEYLIPYPVPPEEFSPGIATWYNTVCNMCPAGCGIVVRTREGRAKKIEGNPSHPVSQGRTCALGQAGLQALYNPDRVTAPMMRDTGRGSASFAEISWNDALSRVGDRLSALRQNSQGNRVVFISDGVRGHVAELYDLFMTQLGSDRLMYHDFEHPETLYAANQKLFWRKYVAVLRHSQYPLPAFVWRGLSWQLAVAGAQRHRFRLQPPGTAQRSRPLRTNRTAHVDQWRCRRRMGARETWHRRHPRARYRTSAGGQWSLQRR